jgi:hypothetical protein
MSSQQSLPLPIINHQKALPKAPATVLRFADSFVNTPDCRRDALLRGGLAHV